MSQLPQFINWLINTPQIITGASLGNLFQVGTTTGTSLTLSAPGDNLRFINSFSAGGNLTVTLPTVASAGSGFCVYFSALNSHDIILNVPDSAVFIDSPGAASSITSITLHSAAEESAQLITDGTNWFVVGRTPVISNVKVQTFASSGTYTPSTGLVNVILFCVGSGGAGGGVTVSSSLQSYGGGGGGSGGLSIKFSPASAIGASQTVTIGAAAAGVSGANGGNGNTTSIGSLCVANGGSGGALNNNSTGFGVGGAGGSAGTGDIAIAGATGGNGAIYIMTSTGTSTFALGGYGGMAPLFSGGAPGGISGGTANAGLIASASGGGGGGAQVVAIASGSAAGGASVAGYAFAIEFCNQ